jgi:hypothetical protein
LRVWALRPIAGLLLLGLVSNATAQQPAASSVRFRFAFGALTGPTQQLKSITQDTTLASGDRIKLMVELLQPGFVYLIHRGSQGDINLLFPPDLKQTMQVSQKYYVPGGSNWFKFDQNAGTESFYVLGSPQRQTSLESMLSRYGAATASGKPAIAAEIVAEIRRLRAQPRPPETPGIIGGNVRSLDSIAGPKIPDIDTIAGLISVPGFYGRAFTIDHK